MKRKIITLPLTALLAANALADTSLAEGEKTYPVWWFDTIHKRSYDMESGEIKEFFKLCENEASYSEIKEYYWDHVVCEGDGSFTWLSDEALDCFKNGNNGIVKISYEKIDHTSFFFIVEEERYDGFSFILTTSEYRQIEKIYHLDERTAYTVSEVLADIDLEDDEKIYWLCLSVSEFYSEIENVDFYPCTDGWNTVDGEQYYVKSDGTLATKSTTIGGIRYKFAKSGICAGKYTGWTKSSKGKRYWKNGELLKNKTVRTKSGKVYKLDRNGYATLKT